MIKRLDVKSLSVFIYGLMVTLGKNSCVSTIGSLKCKERKFEMRNGC